MLNPFDKIFTSLLAALLLCLSRSAYACTVCAEGPAGEGFNLTRAGIYNAGFVANVLMTLAPFLVIGIVVAAIHLHYPESLDEG